MEQTNFLKEGDIVRVICPIWTMDTKLFPKNLAKIIGVYSSPTKYRLSSNKSQTILVEESEIEPVNFVLNETLLKKLVEGEIVLTTTVFEYTNYGFNQDLTKLILSEAKKLLKNTDSCTTNLGGRYYFYSKYYMSLEYTHAASGIPKKIRHVPRICVLEFFTDELEQSEKSNYSIF